MTYLPEPPQPTPPETLRTACAEALRLAGYYGDLSRLASDALETAVRAFLTERFTRALLNAASIETETELATLWYELTGTGIGQIPHFAEELASFEAAKRNRDDDVDGSLL